MKLKLDGCLAAGHSAPGVGQARPLGQLQRLGPALRIDARLVQQGVGQLLGEVQIGPQRVSELFAALAKAGKIFNVPVIYTSVETKSFSGYIWPELLAVHPDVKPIERTSMNSWEDDAFVAAVKATGRKKLVISALWTEVCLTFPALMALEAGYEVYVVTDTSGGTSVDAHERSIDRMVQAGAVPVTWQQVLLEYQRDWSRKATYDAVMDLVREHSGAYGMGVDYAYTMVHGAPERKA